MWNRYLTLTRVVFEFVHACFKSRLCLYLTLTRVVFELKDYPDVKDFMLNLTLTRVVFELQYSIFSVFLYIFNFNKSCIWIKK